MSERPSLGWSTISKSEFSASPYDKLRRFGLLLAGFLLIGTVFYYLTRAVQSSTAHATGDSGLHYDP